MNLKNRISRLASLLSLLSKGYSLSTPKLSERFDVTNKIIQTDFKEYLLPLFDDDTLYYDYSNKSYTAKNNFLIKTFFDVESLAIISILKNKSKDKYSDKDLSQKVNTLFVNYEDALSHSIYQLSDIEKIDKFKNEIIQIHHAIDNKRIIECMYRDKKRNLYPLQIKNLDGYWYLICFDTNYEDIRKYHLNSISKIIELDEYYDGDTYKKIVDSFDTAINAWHKPENKPILIQLFFNKEVSKYFLRKPISKTQRLIKTYDDESCDIELTVTDFMEIIPTIQKFIPHITVLEPIELKNIL
ncbi:MAG: WYL domain-containing protein, partial [Campylobacterota bacterium]|nr:WYL domain-containing protein [Campylobacterota bacterium]